MPRPETETDTELKTGRKDGRKSLLVYMQPDMIKELKRAALDDETTVFALVEEAVQGWLDRRASGPS